MKEIFKFSKERKNEKKSKMTLLYLQHYLNTYRLYLESLAENKHLKAFYYHLILDDLEDMSQWIRHNDRFLRKIFLPSTPTNPQNFNILIVKNKKQELKK